MMVEPWLDCTSQVFHNARIPDPAFPFTNSLNHTISFLFEAAASIPTIIGKWILIRTTIQGSYRAVWITQCIINVVFRAIYDNYPWVILCFYRSRQSQILHWICNHTWYFSRGALLLLILHQAQKAGEGTIPAKRPCKLVADNMMIYL